MDALPYQGRLIVPIDWSGSTAKTTMNAAGYKQTITRGFRPHTQSANLEWKLTIDEAKALVATFDAVFWNGIFSYNCNVRGPIKVRLTGEYSYPELTNAGDYNKVYRVTVGVEMT